jgi:hypothetical protein
MPVYFNGPAIPLVDERRADKRIFGIITFPL